MFEVIFKIWWMIAVLPFLIFIEGSKMLADFLKRKNIYLHWDIWHSSLLLFIIVFIILWFKGYHLW